MPLGASTFRLWWTSTISIRVGEIGGGLLGKTAQHGDAHADVTGEEHRDLLGGLVDQGLLFRGVAGGANHHGGTDGLGICQHVGDGGVVGEIDHHVRLHLAQLGEGLRDAVLPVDGHPAHALGAQDLVDQLTHGAIGTAKDYLHTSIPSFLICS